MKKRVDLFLILIVFLVVGLVGFVNATCPSLSHMQCPSGKVPGTLVDSQGCSHIKCCNLNNPRPTCSGGQQLVYGSGMDGCNQYLCCANSVSPVTCQSGEFSVIRQSNPSNGICESFCQTVIPYTDQQITTMNQENDQLNNPVGANIQAANAGAAQGQAASQQNNNGKCTRSADCSSNFVCSAGICMGFSLKPGQTITQAQIDKARADADAAMAAREQSAADSQIKSCTSNSDCSCQYGSGSCAGGICQTCPMPVQNPANSNLLKESIAKNGIIGTLFNFFTTGTLEGTKSNVQPAVFSGRVGGFCGSKKSLGDYAIDENGIPIACSGNSVCVGGKCVGKVNPNPVPNPNLWCPPEDNRKSGCASDKTSWTCICSGNNKGIPTGCSMSYYTCPGEKFCSNGSCVGDTIPVCGNKICEAGEANIQGPPPTRYIIKGTCPQDCGNSQSCNSSTVGISICKDTTTLSVCTPQLDNAFSFIDKKCPSEQVCSNGKCVSSTSCISAGGNCVQGTAMRCCSGSCVAGASCKTGEVGCSGTCVTNQIICGGLLGKKCPVSYNCILDNPNVADSSGTCVCASVADCPAPPQGCHYVSDGSCTCGQLVCPNQ